MIPQDPLLFHTSLRSNLDPANEHTDEKIWDALDKSQMKETVSALKGGLGHEVEEGKADFQIAENKIKIQF